MTQRDRERLVVLKKAHKSVITQQQAPTNWRSRRARYGVCREG
jgi:hypothetical protein